MGGFAWVTLATNDSYSLGALVLANSLKNVGTAQQLVVLVTPGVTDAMREKLRQVFNLVQEVNILDSKDEANLRLLKRPELGITFTKLHCWRLTQFDKCVFLDADTLVLQNCDELFEREELSAAPDVGWPDCFNSGVFVYRPSNETYESLVKFALERGSFDGGDQGLLNLYFSDWATKDISKHLPFIYNLCSTALYSYLPAFKQFGADAKIVHFIGATKPWLQYFNTETRKVQPSNDLKHLENVLQQWWNIFCTLIHPNLTSEMARSDSDVTHTNYPPPSSQNYDPRPRTPTNEIWDPWDEYDQKQTLTPLEPCEPEVTPIESLNTNACVASQELPPSPSPVIESYVQPEEIAQCFSQDVPDPICNDGIHCSPFSQDSPQENLNISEVSDPVPIEPYPSVLPSECQAPATVCTETTLHTPLEDPLEDAGLAGAFAQLTLGAPRTSEQSALDDHLRRQGWEIGNIDYLGKDSFDNIWSKICKTLGTDPQPQEPQESTPAAEAKAAEQATTEAPVQETASQALESDSPQFPFPPKQVEAPQPVSATSLASESPQPETVQPGKPESPVTEPVPTPASPQPTPSSPQPIPATPEPIIPASPQPTPASPQPTPDSPQPTPESPQPTPASPQPTPASPQATPASPQPQPTPASPQPTPASPPPTPASPQPQPTPASPQSTPASPQPQPTPASPQPTPASPPPTPASPQPQPTPASPQPTPASPQPTPASPQSTPASPQPQPTPASPQPTPASPQPTPASPQPTPASPQPTPASPQPVPTSPQTPASPQPAPTSPQPAAGPQQPQTETPKPEKPTPSSPKSVAPKPESTPVATKSVKEEAPKSPEASESKQLPESAQSASGASPTPPPRKGSGGAKKTTKSKK